MMGGGVGGQGGGGGFGWRTGNYVLLTVNEV